jgi:hypothetical protein
MQHLATIYAFYDPRGFFIGKIINHVEKQEIISKFDTMDLARNWVKQTAFEMFGAIYCASIRRKGEYLANVWKKQEYTID